MIVLRHQYMYGSKTCVSADMATTYCKEVGRGTAETAESSVDAAGAAGCTGALRQVHLILPGIYSHQRLTLMLVNKLQSAYYITKTCN